MKCTMMPRAGARFDPRSGGEKMSNSLQWDRVVPSVILRTCARSVNKEEQAPIPGRGPLIARSCAARAWRQRFNAVSDSQC